MSDYKQVACRRCGTGILLTPDMANHTVRCPRCRRLFRVTPYGGGIVTVHRLPRWAKPAAEVAVLAIIVFGLVALWANSDLNRPSPRSKPAGEASATLNAYVMAQNFVEDRLTSPATAKWPPLSSVEVRNLGGGHYSVTGYLDSQNEFGALTRSRYVCNLKDEGSGRWSLQSLHLE